MNTLRIKIVLLVTAVLIIAGCSTLQKQIKQPELSLSDARITAMSLSDMQVAFDVDVANPNPVGVTMKGLSYALQIDDKSLFNGALSEKLHIDANGTSRVAIPFTLRYEEIYGTLLALRDHKELNYTISGDANFGLITLPYKKSGTFSLPRLPDISVESVRITSLGLSGVDLALALNIDNANSFSIRLDGLDYNLKLADSSLFKGKSAAPFAVEGGKKGKLELNLNLNYSQLGSLLQTLRSASSLPIEFNSTMKLPALQGTTTLPYTWKGEVPLYR